MNYCIIDETDPNDAFECEGHVLKTFFKSSGLFDTSRSLELIRKTPRIEQCLMKRPDNYFNIVQLSAHGIYTRNTKADLAYSSIVQRRGNREKEIFRPDSIVRTGLGADLFISMNCQTFNPLFIDVIKNYKGVSNFIAPINCPYIGNTLIFSMMFYNLILGEVGNTTVKISDKIIIEAFKLTKCAYSKYNSDEDYRLYNRKLDTVFK